MQASTLCTSRNSRNSRNFGTFLSCAAAIALFASQAMAANIDLKASTLQWKGTKKVGEFHTGKIKLKSAQWGSMGDGLEGAQFIVDMTTLTVEDIKKEKWAKKFVAHMSSADFFEVATHPTAKLVLGKKVDADTVQGMLTVKGKTQPVTMDFKHEGNHHKGTLTFDRTKFGLVYGSKNFFKKLIADKIINDEISIAFDIVTAS